MTAQGFRRKLRNFTFQKAYHKLQRGVWSTGSGLLLARSIGLPEPEERPFTGEIRAVTEADLPDCAVFEDAAHYIPVYRRALEKGDLVLFGYLNGVCVFRCCLQKSGSIAYREHIVRELTAGEAYVHYVFCASWARRQGFHEAALRYLCAACPDRVLYAEVKENNIPSLRGFFRVGYRPYSRLTVKKRFFRSTLTEAIFTEAEAAAILKSAMTAGKR